MDSPVCIYGTKYVDVQQYTPVKGPGGVLESRISNLECTLDIAGQRV
jgi:hypothetical protein